jgi:hypothetical protein
MNVDLRLHFLKGLNLVRVEAISQEAQERFIEEYDSLNEILDPSELEKFLEQMPQHWGYVSYPYPVN